jgi:copper chaperone CopZ
MKKIFEVDGMHCKSCKSLIEDELSSMKSIKEYKVSLENKSMEIDMSQDCTREVLEAVKGLGYKVKVKS